MLSIKIRNTKLHKLWFEIERSWYIIMWLSSEPGWPSWWPYWTLVIATQRSEQPPLTQSQLKRIVNSIIEILYQNYRAVMCVVQHIMVNKFVWFISDCNKLSPSRRESNESGMEDQCIIISFEWKISCYTDLLFISILSALHESLLLLLFPFLLFFTQIDYSKIIINYVQHRLLPCCCYVNVLCIMKEKQLFLGNTSSLYVQHTLCEPPDNITIKSQRNAEEINGYRLGMVQGKVELPWYYENACEYDR